MNLKKYLGGFTLSLLLIMSAQAKADVAYVNTQYNSGNGSVDMLFWVLGNYSNDKICLQYTLTAPGRVGETNLCNSPSKFSYVVNLGSDWSIQNLYGYVIQYSTHVSAGSYLVSGSYTLYLKDAYGDHTSSFTVP